MNCWLNIHTPVARGENRRENDRYVYLQDRGEHFANEISKGDFAVIYETVTVQNDGIITVNGKPLPNPAYAPRGGIVAFVRIISVFQLEKTPYEYNGDIYIGNFEGEYVRKSDDINKPIVPFKVIDSVWMKECKRHFVPHLGGGFRRLKPDECRAVSKLLGLNLQCED